MLQNLELISMENIYLSGTIPPFLGNLTSLVELTLSENNPMGSIPTGLARLSRLQYFLVSLNNLTGRIPDEIFLNLSSLIIISIPCSNYV